MTKPANHVWTNDQRHRIVVERVKPRDTRTHFEALIPIDATEGEVTYFVAQVLDILKRKRARTRKDTPP